jgi:glycosyltransferase involved in cell wall biosynthesis
MGNGTMKKDGILLMFHCQQFTGYAIGVLEKVFFDAAVQAGYTKENIYWSFSKVLDATITNTIECEYKNSAHTQQLDQFLSQHEIQTAIAFDLGYPATVIHTLKKHNVNLISYWGASMSSLNSGLKLLIKKIEWRIRKDKPDYFIFESSAMQLTATHGRGVPQDKTCVIHLGVDTEKFSSNYENYFYAHEQLNISKNKKIIFYSGHMEERKGVHIIVQAAIKLFDLHPDYPMHFVICGNKSGQENRFLEMLSNSSAATKVSFAGYRTDIEHMMRSSSIGVIASTGWDSFTMSSVEMMSSGLPLIVSNLQGLAETIVDGINGFHITPGDSTALAALLLKLCNDDQLRRTFSNNSRERAINQYSRKIQVDAFAGIINNLSDKRSHKTM